MVRCIAAVATVALGLAGVARSDPVATSSVVCGTCHRDIYAMWRASAHSTALESVVFQDAMREVDAHDPATARLCLGCHAPLAEPVHDGSLTQAVTWEGVSCDACHSLASVELGPSGATQVFDLGRVKRGPIQDAVSTAHDVAYSRLHTTALVCAGCHEFRNAEGTPIITTYTEWQESGASRAGRSCQDCHMRLTRADVVDPKVKRVARTEVNLHEIPGGHSAAQLNKALVVSQTARRDATGLTVDVVLANKGAGHAVPTGMPGRTVVLEIGVRAADGSSFQERRTYTKRFLTAAGEPITKDGRVFASGVRFDSDSRIMPDEERTETFHFPMAATATATVSVKLRYEHDPGGAPENRTSMAFFTQERIVPPAAH